MIKVRILTTCPICNGQAYLPLCEAVDGKSRPYIKHAPCPNCEGTGMASKWIPIEEFTQLLAQAQCTHQHTSLKTGVHPIENKVWDDMQEVCDDCGATLEGQTLGDFITDVPRRPDALNLLYEGIQFNLYRSLHNQFPLRRPISVRPSPCLEKAGAFLILFPRKEQPYEHPINQLCKGSSNYNPINLYFDHSARTNRRPDLFDFH
jgi:hypothetical protein